MTLKSLARKESDLFIHAFIDYVNENPFDYIEDGQILPFTLDPDDPGVKEAFESFKTMGDFTKTEREFIQEEKEEILEILIKITNVYEQPFIRTYQHLQDIAEDQKLQHQNIFAYHGLKQADFL